MNRSIRICALLVVATWATGTLAGGPSLQPKMGEPLADLTPFGLLLFEDGKTQFTRVFTAEEGLGPAPTTTRSVAEKRSVPKMLTRASFSSSV